MSGGIFLLRGENELLPMVETAYVSEDVVQELVARFPELLAGDQLPGAVARRWLLVGREASLPAEEDGAGRWSVDHLFLDQDAVPTLVEVKRSSDTRIRREVVGQMLDYAAHAVVYWPLERLRATFERRCEDEGLDPEAELTAVLEPGAEGEQFWEQAGANLKAGRVRLVFVADEVPAELRRVVEFLNGQMDAEVVAVEVKQYAGEGARTLVPRLIGQTAASESRKGRREARQWDEASFLAELERTHGRGEVAVARELLAWARGQRMRVTWGRGRVEGSFIPVLDHGGQSHYPLAVYTSGRCEIQFQWLRPPFDDPELRRAFLRRVNQIPGVHFPEDAITRRPRVLLSLLAADPEALRVLLQALEWFSSTVRAES